MGAVLELLISSEGHLPARLGLARVWFREPELSQGSPDFWDVAKEYVCVWHYKSQSQEPVKRGLKMLLASRDFQCEKGCFW